MVTWFVRSGVMALALFGGESCGCHGKEEVENTAGTCFP